MKTAAVALAGVVALAGCGEPLYSREQSLDLVDCSLAGWGVRSMPRRACTGQNGIPLDSAPEREEGPK